MFSQLRHSAALFLFVFTMTPVHAQMSGTYVIDPGGGGDYISFAAAIADLNTLGVNGPVVMEVANGSYFQRVVVSPIAGASATNTITFRGQALDSTLANVIVSTSTSTTFNPNYAVRINGAQHITFEHLSFRRAGSATYAHVVSIQGPAADITFRRCRFQGVVNPAPAPANQNLVHVDDAVLQTGIRFTENRFENGRYSVYWRGSSLADEIRMEGNVLYNSGILFNAVDGGVHLIDNLFTSNTVVSALFLNNVLSDCDGGFEFRGNRMYSNASTALLISNCVGTPTNKGLLVNNFMRGTGAACVLQTVQYVDMLHNSCSGRVDITGGPGAEVRLINNSFFSPTFLAIRVQDLTAVSEADYNCYYLGSGSSFATWNGTHSTIADLNAATGFDANSRNQDPLYVNAVSDLHLQSGSPCAGNGTPLASVTADADGEPRPQPVATMPDIGADETTEYCFTLNGTYTIGPSVVADFPSFTSAIRKMQNCGINGPVVFEVEDGTYNEQLDLAPVSGNSSVNTITFRGMSMDSSLVRVEWPASFTPANNHLMHWRGMEWVSMEHITFNRPGGSQYKRVVYVDPNATGDQYLRLRNCAVLYIFATNNNGHLIERENGPGEPQLELEACHLSGGYSAMWWTTGGPMEHISITDCIRTTPNAGFYFANFAGTLTMSGNQLEGRDQFAVALSNCTGPFTFTKNKVHSIASTTASGLTLYNVAPLAPSRALIANNEFLYRGRLGINIGGDLERIDVVHNSFHMQRYDGYALYAASGTGTEVNVRNNVFSGTGTNPVYVTNTGVQGDHNCFHTTGFFPLAILWGGTHTDIATLSLATGTNANSIIADPKYYDGNNDLHAYGMEINDAAQPFPGVTTDKDGLPRDPTLPDMGAYEFTPELWNEAFNTCGPADPITSTGGGQDQWIYKDRKVVARFNDNGQVLGTVNMNVYVNNGPVRQSLIGQHYLDRNWQLSTQLPITTGAIVRLFHSGDEFGTYATADPAVGVPADAGVAHYAGPMEDCSLMNNPPGNIWTPLYPAAPALEPRIQGNGGTHGYTAVLDDDGELYITTFGLPLPVELLSFSAERITEGEVLMQWTTATELDNAGFEVWRMIDGEVDLRQIAWVDGQGTTQQLSDYTHLDPNPSDRISYYRIKQVDHNGEFSWSPTMAVRGTDRMTGPTIFPNPASGMFRILGKDALRHVLLLDASGREVHEMLPDEHYALDGISPGVYIVQVVYTNGIMKQQRLIVE